MDAARLLRPQESSNREALHTKKGWVSVRGKNWHGYFRRAVLDPETNQTNIISSPILHELKSQMSKFEARVRLVEEITMPTGPTAGDDPLKTGLSLWPVRSKPTLSFEGSGLEDRNRQREEAAHHRDIIDEFDDVPMESFDRFTL